MKYLFLLLLTIVTYSAQAEELNLGMPVKFLADAQYDYILDGQTPYNDNVNGYEVEAFVGLSIQPSKHFRITNGITYIKTSNDVFGSEQETEGFAYTLKIESAHTIGYVK